MQHDVENESGVYAWKSQKMPIENDAVESKGRKNLKAIKSNWTTFLLEAHWQTWGGTLLQTAVEDILRRYFCS